MINSVIDTLNSLQNINTPAGGKSTVSDSENTSVSYTDKNSNSFIKDGFEKVYNQKTSQLQEKQHSGEPQTIGELKESFNKAVAGDSESFQEIVSEAVDESNAESALDLTLARDINEIISELKEAAGIAEKNDEEDSENPDSITSDTDSETVESDDAENMEVKDLDILVAASVEQANYTQPINSTGDTDSAEIDSSVINNKISVSDKPDSQTSSETLIDFEVPETDTNTQTTEKTSSSEGDFENLLEEDKLKELNIESIEADTNTSSNEGSSLMDNQSPQEQAVKAMLHSDGESFDINMPKTNQTVQSQSVQAKPADITPSKIIEQITKQMEGLFNNSKVNIVLNPESLGRVHIQLVNSSDGLSAHFTVGSNEVKDMLMKGLDGLKDTLASHGVGVDNVSVKVSDTQKEADTPDWTEQEGSRGGNKGQSQPDREEKEKGLFEKMMAQTNEEFKNGNV